MATTFDFTPAEMHVIDCALAIAAEEHGKHANELGQICDAGAQRLAAQFTLQRMECLTLRDQIEHGEKDHAPV